MKSKIKKEVSLKEYSTFKIGGKAKYFVEIKRLDELKKVLNWALKEDVKYFVLGGGSNVLFSDEGFDGLVVRIKKDDLELDGKNRIISGAGSKLSDLMNFSIEKNLSGLEWAAGIPGTVGGAVRGNAGAFGSEMKDSIIRVQALKIDNNDIKLKEFSKSECEFGYRESLFKKKNNLIIWEVELGLEEGSAEESKQKIKEIIQKRKQKQPSLEEYYSAGSVFKNPEVGKEIIDLFQKETGVASKDNKVPAGWLIDMCDLKGLEVGGAKISPDQANFIINKGDARSQDVATLISLIKQKVRNNYGIQLREEVQLVGF
ncbi:MAG: UDP-N-acetylmuramate dehydrogenase [Candidatus Moraniibacteriota bacterium]